MKMAKAKVQPGVSVSRPLWERFRQDVEKRRGTVHGNLSHELESAINAYLEGSEGGDMTDELRRIREQIEELGGSVSEQNDGSERDSISKTTEDRISDIMADVRDRADELETPRVREEDVEAAIERNAGASYKTIQRYKKLLQNQREIFAHPSIEDVYFVRAASFIACVEQGGDGKLRQSDAQQIRDTYGDEWWVENAPNGMLDEDKRGFA